MSEPRTLYEDPDPRLPWQDIEGLTGLVRVVPCEHGNYAPHLDPTGAFGDKCDGKPEADNG